MQEFLLEAIVMRRKYIADVLFHKDELGFADITRPARTGIGMGASA